MLRSDFPFAPSRLPVFYGWIILAVGTLGILMSLPGQTVGVSVFTDPLIAVTGLGRAGVSNAYLVGTLLSGLSLPWAGTLLDRWGARTTAVAASLGLGATLLFLSRLDRVFAIFSPPVPVGAAILVLGFFGLRLCGQGTLTMVGRTLIGRWFDRRRGLASGLSGVVVGFGFGIAPQLLHLWVEAAGWQGAWLQMAALVGLGMGSVALVFFRDDPESCGLRLDGNRTAAPGVEDRPAGRSHTRAEALRTAAFWTVTAALGAQALVMTGVTFHVVDLGAEVGLSRSEAVFVFVPLAVVSTALGLVGGVLADRISVRLMVGIMMVGLGAGLYGAADLSTRFGWAVAGFGTSAGLYGPIGTVAYPRLFGRRHLGAIVGAEMMALVISSALGPSLLAASRETLGSYGPALAACSILPVAVGAMAIRLRPKV